MEQSELVTVEAEALDRPAVDLVRVIGELDFASTPLLSTALAGLPGPGRALVLDLSRLEFCDSSGLGELIAAHKRAAATGRGLYLADVGPAVRAAITATSLDQLFVIRPDVAAVLAELS